MERSPELKGFIETRGMPDALEAVKSWSKPTTLRFYYIDKKEYYSAEESDNTWILHGPQKIPAGGVKLLLSIVEGGENTAPPVNEKSLALRLPSSGTQEYKPNERPQAPPPAIKSLSSSGSTWDDPLLPTVLRYKDTTTQMAEISPNGDLVHHVSYPGESLMMITRWYTFDIRNVGRISRINDIKNPSHVDIGDTIIIPSYLVKNKKRLSEEVLRNLYKDLEGKL